MKKGETMRPVRDGRRSERGQLLVLFTLGLVAIISMVGLVLDAGSAYAQRRQEQNVSDLAAMAGANAYLNTPGSASARTAAAIAAAEAAASRNGYVSGSNGASVDVAVTLLATGARVQVDVSKPHANNFARIVPGMETWDVSTTASAVAGVPSAASGPGPWTMSIDAFNEDATPRFGRGSPFTFGEANGDYPASAEDLAWTDFSGADNVNTSEVRNIITGSSVIDTTIQFDQYIGQHNQGFHNALFRDVDQNLRGHDVPIPIVGTCPDDPSNKGCFKGWVLFHVIGAEGGSSKTITGYFLTDFIREPLYVGECRPGMPGCGLVPGSPLGAYQVKLTN